jgi:acetyl/propionyl-CoA carboxylase alpha subunit
MRIVNAESELPKRLNPRVKPDAFGDERLLEKYVAKHIMWSFRSLHGHGTVHLFERECSSSDGIKRSSKRPSPLLSPELRGMTLQPPLPKLSALQRRDD